MRPKEFVRELADLNFDRTFNPYRDRCVVFDRTDAVKRRRDVLSKILEAAVVRGVDGMWIGRDLGHRGGRRTGLAFTDDAHLDAHAARWGVSAKRPTLGRIVRERTAEVVWQSLTARGESVFLWNVFPLHPHEEGNSFSNRRHNGAERHAGEGLLREVIGLVKPRRLVAVGADAEAVARRLARDEEVVRVRHPSYGGQVQFQRQVRELTEVGAGR